MRKTLIQLSTIIFVAALLSSCSLFRKKNKCMSCPKWDDNIELSTEIQQEALLNEYESRHKSRIKE